MADLVPRDGWSRQGLGLGVWTRILAGEWWWLIWFIYVYIRLICGRYWFRLVNDGHWWWMIATDGEWSSSVVNSGLWWLETFLLVNDDRRWFKKWFVLRDCWCMIKVQGYLVWEIQLWKPLWSWSILRAAGKSTSAKAITSWPWEPFTDQPWPWQQEPSS